MVHACVFRRRVPRLRNEKKLDGRGMYGGRGRRREGRVGGEGERVEGGLAATHTTKNVDVERRED